MSWTGFTKVLLGAIMTNMKTQNTLYILNIDFLKDPEQFDLWYSQMPDFRKRKIDAFIDALLSYNAIFIRL